MSDKKQNTEVNITARQFGKEFSSGFIQEILKYAAIMFAIFFMLKITSMFLMPVDNCDIDRFNRCGMKVVTDAKTGKQYLLSPYGGIIERGNE